MKDGKMKVMTMEIGVGKGRGAWGGNWPDHLNDRQTLWSFLAEKNSSQAKLLRHMSHMYHWLIKP